MVRRALAAEQSGAKQKNLSWRTIAAATAGLCVIAIIMAVIFGQFLLHRPQVPAPSGEGNTNIVAAITNESGPVELRLYNKADAGPDPSPVKPVPSEPSVQIFNQDGLVAAEVVDGGVSFLVIGGDK